MTDGTDAQPSQAPPHATGPGAVGPGLYGKVSSNGDFVSRRLPRAFIDPWDTWLQAAIAGSRDRLGDDWLPAYLSAPIWRFMLSPGLCSEHVVAGIIMPSIDRVGRHFPLTLAALMDLDTMPAAVFAASAPWFRALEDLALSTLDDNFDFDRFDSDLLTCGPPTYAAPVGSATAAISLEGVAWRLQADPACDAGPADPTVVHQILRALVPRHSLWWSGGSARVAPSFLVCDGLPSVERFTALLDGRWRQWTWSGAADEAPITGL